MRSSPMRPIAFAIAGLSMLGSGTVALGQIQCRLQGLVCSTTDKSCAKLPTSLPIANGVTTTGPGWSNDGSACGFNYSTKKSCGDKLSKSVCNADSGGGPGTCGGPYDPCPCDPKAIDCCDPTTDPTCGGDGGGGDVCLPDDPCYYSAPIHVSSRLAEVGNVGLPPSVERLLHAYAQIKGLHVKARALVKVWPAANSQGGQALAPYEYWASGDRYHIHAPLDPRLGISNVTDVAFDGRHHELVILFGLQTMLSVQSGDTRLEPIALDNPAFLPLSFLAAKDAEKCPACEVRLHDLTRLDKLRSVAPRTISQVNRFEIPGGRSGGDAKFAVELDSAGRIAKISHLSTAGQVFETVVFEDYRPVSKAGFDFPHRITENRNDEHGVGPWLTVKYVVDKIDVSEALDDSPFRISPDKVDEVWDTDTSRFLKRGDLSAAGLCKS
jgi:hypothetical protein